jgi:hypothetical protein
MAAAATTTTTTAAAQTQSRHPPRRLRRPPRDRAARRQIGKHEHQQHQDRPCSLPDHACRASYEEYRLGSAQPLLALSWYTRKL